MKDQTKIMLIALTAIALTLFTGIIALALEHDATKTCKTKCYSNNAMYLEYTNNIYFEELACVCRDNKNNILMLGGNKK